MRCRTGPTRELAGEVRLACFEPSDTRGKAVQVERMEMFRAAYRYSWTKTPAGCTLVLSGDPIMEIPANKEIARILVITERTVKFHVSNILSKLGLERRTELVQWHEPI
jgi:hypothetical protein